MRLVKHYKLSVIRYISAEVVMYNLITIVILLYDTGKLLRE